MVKNSTTTVTNVVTYLFAFVPPGFLIIFTSPSISKWICYAYALSVNLPFAQLTLIILLSSVGNRQAADWKTWVLILGATCEKILRGKMAGGDLIEVGEKSACCYSVRMLL